MAIVPHANDVQARRAKVIMILVDPMIAPLTKDARYADIVRRMNLVPPSGLARVAGAR